MIPKSGQVTIKDIARELDISPSTVSRALKDHPDISPETKKAVNELAEKLHYEPNTIALSLRKSRTYTIGVIIPEIVHFFFSTVISGIEDVAYSSGYNVIVCQSNENHEREVIDAKALISHRVDGLLISLSKTTTDFTHFREIYDRGVPIVFFDRICEELNTSRVMVDDYYGAFQATEHLIEMDSKRIAHLSGPETLLISKNRLQGYKDALIKHDLEIDEQLIRRSGTVDYDEGRNVTQDLLKLENPPDAIFANNDMTAIGAMAAIKENALKIPDDVAVVGFSDWLMASMVEPSLSSVSQPGFEMGQIAARMFIEQIESKDENFAPKTKIFPTHLIIRDSSRRKK